MNRATVAAFALLAFFLWSRPELIEGALHGTPQQNQGQP